jgi:hypothetical protein
MLGTARVARHSALGEAQATINNTLGTELFSRWRLRICETISKYDNVASSLYL